MARHLQKELDRLKKLIYALSARIDESMELAVKSVQENDVELARTVIQGETAINELEVEVEEECLKALALYQPVAIDLRFIVAVLKLNSDLERIGDLAADIAKNGIALAKLPHPSISVDLYKMFGLVKAILRKSLNALIEIDPESARTVISDDLEINAMKSAMKSAIIAGIINEPANAEPLLVLLAISNRLERIGDHASNIAEDVIYMADAEIVRHQETT